MAILRIYEAEEIVGVNMEKSDYKTKLPAIAVALTLLFVAGFAITSSSSTRKGYTVANAVQNSGQEQYSGVKQETEYEDIAYETKTVDDANLEYGQTVVRVPGVTGTKKVVYNVTYKNGKVVSRVVLSEEVTVQPTAQVIARGTKIVWHCVDVTSYDRNPYNDNLCISSTGEERYLSDSQAEMLDPFYNSGKSGAWYYNNK